MATLTNTKIKDTYKSLLKVSDNGNLEAGLQEITDGEGNASGVQLNTAGDLTASGTLAFGELKDSGENITITKFVDEADGIGSNDNDTSIPTSAAVKDYVDTKVTAEDLDFGGDSGTGSVDLDSQTFTIAGTANEVVTSASGQTLTIGLPSSISVDVQGDLTGNVTATSVLADGVTATTQSPNDNSTKVATTAYVDAQVTAEDLDFAGDSGTGAVDLDSQTFTIAGTANEIETSASGNTLTVGLPSDVTIGNDLTVTGAISGTLSTAAQPNITSVGTLSSLDVSGDLTVDSGTLFVDSSTNRVGIGLVSPSSDIHLRKSVDSDLTLRIENTNSGSSATSELNMVASGNNFNIINYPDADTSNANRTDFISTAGGSYFTFSTTGSEKVRITSNGDVGIGESSPIRPLHVNGGTDNVIALFESTDVTSAIEIKDDTGSSSIYSIGGVMRIDGSTGTQTLRLNDAATLEITEDNIVDGVTLRLNNTHNGSDWGAGTKIGVIDFYSEDASGVLPGVVGAIELVQTGTSISYPSETAIVFKPSDAGVTSEIMRIEGDGKVGIGTDTPDSIIHLADAAPIITLEDTTDNSISDILFNNSAMFFRVDRTDIGSDSRFIWTADDVEKMRLDSTGLGIGTNSPSVEVEIASAAPQIRLTDTDGGYCDIANVSGNLFLQADKGGTESGSSIRFDVDGSERMRIDADGNIGIGVSNPSTNLEIGGVTQPRLGIIAAGSTGASQINFGDDDDGAKGRVRYNHDVDSLAFYADSDLKMVIGADGKTGFGVASPDELMVLAATNSQNTSNNTLRFEDLDTGAQNNQPLGKIEWYTRDNNEEGVKGSLYVNGYSDGRGGQMIFDTQGSASNACFFTFTNNGSEIFKVTETGINILGGASALDDYEEGSFTPVVSDAATGGNTASGTFVGTYTKIGRIVNITVTLDNIDTTGMTSGNTFLITGLPFTVVGNSYGSLVAHGVSFYSAGYSYFSAQATGGTDYALIRQTGGSIADRALTVAEIDASSSDIYFTITYQA